MSNCPRYARVWSNNLLEIFQCFWKKWGLGSYSLGSYMPTGRLMLFRDRHGTAHNWNLIHNTQPTRKPNICWDRTSLVTHRNCWVVFWNDFWDFCFVSMNVVPGSKASDVVLVNPWLQMSYYRADMCTWVTTPCRQPSQSQQCFCLRCL